MFFPPGNDTAALLGTFAVFGVTLFVRPVGGMYWGNLGDKVGRRIRRNGPVRSDLPDRQDGQHVRAWFYLMAFAAIALAAVLLTKEIARKPLRDV